MQFESQSTSKVYIGKLFSVVYNTWWQSGLRGLNSCNPTAGRPAVRIQALPLFFFLYFVAFLCQFPCQFQKYWISMQNFIKIYGAVQEL